MSVRSGPRIRRSDRYQSARWPSPTSRYRSGPVRRNNGWDELIRPVAVVSRYPAASRMSIISARVRSRPAARATITRCRSGAETPPGGSTRRPGPGCTRPRSTRRSDRRATRVCGPETPGACDRGGQGRQIHGPAAAITRAAARATVLCSAGIAPARPDSSSTGPPGRAGLGCWRSAPAQVIVARHGRTGCLHDQRRRQREPGTGGADGRDVVGDMRGHAVAAGDLSQVTGRAVEETVVAQHDPRSGWLEWAEGTVRQLGNHLGRGTAR